MANTTTQVATDSFDSIITEFDLSQQPENQQPTNFMSNETPFDIIEKEVVKEQTDPKKEEKKQEEQDKGQGNFDDVIKAVDESDEQDDPKGTPEKPASIFFEALNELSEESKIFLFEDDKPLSEYTKEELKELIELNKSQSNEEAKEKAITEFFEALPEQLQYAAKYALNGGTDLTSVFKALSATSDVKSLDPKKDSDKLITEYYSALGWSDEEVAAKLSELADLGDTAKEKEATRVKPKLEQMNEEVVKSQIKRQEAEQEKRQQELDLYFTNALESIKTGKLGEVKIDPKVQNNLYNGIVQASYKTRTGRPTNKLGHLLEKYQYVEPNFEKIYKALWVLEDEEGFIEAVSKNKLNQQTEKLTRTLKTEQSKASSSSDNTTGNQQQVIKKKTIKKPVNFLENL